jgi:hypothetical protein
LSIGFGNFFSIHLRDPHISRSNERVTEEKHMFISIIKCVLWSQLKFMMEPGKVIDEGVGNNKGVHRI